MANVTATSDPAASSLRSSDGARNGPLCVDLLKRFVHLESQIQFLESKNERSSTACTELEDELRRQRRISEERDEMKSNLERDVKTMEGKYERLKKKYDTLVEGSESGERKWKAQVEENKIKCCMLHLKKSEMSLTAELKSAQKLLEEKDRKNESLVKLNSEMMKKVESLESEISEMKKENEDLKRQTMRIEEVEKIVERWADYNGFGTDQEKTRGCDVHHKGPKSTGISTLIVPKQESKESTEQLTGPKTKHIILISDDEEEEETKPTLSFASPSNAERPPAVKRKSEATIFAAKRCNSNATTDGKHWEDAKQMLEALKGNNELCMKSICALYRKHKSLGVWKNQSDRNKGFHKTVYLRGVALGEILTDKDPEGRMKKSAAELAQADPRGLFHCEFIAKSHVEVLFEIYINKQDPFFP